MAYKNITKSIADTYKRMREELEQVDELSKNTLQNYVGKALVSIHNKGFKSGQQIEKEPQSAFKTATSSIKRQINVRKAVDKLAKEDVQIDELSKKTLGSYVNKAARSATARTRLSKDFERSADNALVKADKHNWNGPHGSYKPVKTKDSENERVHREISHEFKKDADKRLQGIAKATAKLTKEDVLTAEEIARLDELSKKTLGSYIKKATNDARIRGELGTDFEHSAKNSDRYGEREALQHRANQHFRKAWSREENIGKAVDKLTKEEFDALDEISKKTLGSYIKKAKDEAGLIAHGLGHQIGASPEPGITMRPDYVRQKGKYVQRSKGINTAVNKLTNESEEDDRQSAEHHQQELEHQQQLELQKKKKETKKDHDMKESKQPSKHKPSWLLAAELKAEKREKAAKGVSEKFEHEAHINPEREVCSRVNQKKNYMQN